MDETTKSLICLIQENITFILKNHKDPIEGWMFQGSLDSLTPGESMGQPRMVPPDYEGDYRDGFRVGYDPDQSPTLLGLLKVTQSVVFDLAEEIFS